MKVNNVLSRLNCMYYVSTVSDSGKWKAEFVNDAIENLIGQKPSEYLQGINDWLHFIHPEDRDLALLGVKNLNNTEGEATQEYRIVHLNGTIKHVRDAKITFIEGGVLKVSGVIMDISDYKFILSKNEKLVSDLIVKNNELQLIIKSFNVINSLVSKENIFLQENISLLFQAKIAPLLLKISSDINRPIIDQIETEFSNILSEAFFSLQLKPLSPRENEIAQLISQGKSYKEIAHQLSISLDTVKSHLKNIKKKLSLADTNGSLESFHKLTKEKKVGIEQNQT